MTDEKPANPIVFHAQYIRDLSFENPNAPDSIALTRAPKIEIDVDTEARANQTGDLHEVVLKVNANATNDDKTVFVIELEYAAIVKLNGVPDAHKLPALLIEVPRMLFPFARQIVSDATVHGGFPPLMMHPIDFAALFRNKFANGEEKQPENQTDTRPDA